jgi:glycosyltransferase involved in cell wall biosynthesis
VISVIIPVKNGLPLLEEQLKALLDQECSQPWEIIVADNGSTDRTVEVVKGWACRDSRLRLVDASAARGVAATRNLGARCARGGILAFCDADDVVRRGWVESWIHALADADVASGLVDYWSLDDLPSPSPRIPRPPPMKNQFSFLEGALGGNMAVRRVSFERVGGFDEALDIGEDTDLCWRLQIAGYRFAIGEGVVSRREPTGFHPLFSKSMAYGRCGVVLYQRYRAVGLRREGRAAVLSWLWVVATIPRLPDPNFRRSWARVAGWRVGRVAESCRRRIFFP